MFPLFNAMRKLPLGTLVVLSCLSLPLSGVVPMAAFAQQAENDQRAISVELNTADNAAAACRLTFVASNTLGIDIDRLAFEMVLFNAAGLVDQITVFNFGAMPDGKTLAKQFEIAGKSCDQFSRVLINSVTACDTPDATLSDCQSAIRTTSRASLEFGL